MENNYFMFRLRKALEDKGITRTELSQISTVAKGDITHYLKGDYVPKQDKCYLLAKALDVDPGWLMTGNEPNVKETNDAVEDEPEDVPKTPEARAVSYGMDSLPKEQRELILNMVKAMFPDTFTKGNNEDEA